MSTTTVPFVVIEGADGSGKSSLLAALTDHLTKLGLRVFTTRDPGATEVATDIRAILLNRREGEQVTPLAELFLFLAARAQLLAKLREVRSSGDYDVILCDRYVYSTLAYQGARGYTTEMMVQLHMTLFHDLAKTDYELAWPFTLLMSGPYDLFASRLAARSGDKDRLETEDDDYKRRVYERYASFPAHFHGVHKVDATGSPEEVLHSAVAVLTSLHKDSAFDVLRLDERESL